MSNELDRILPLNWEVLTNDGTDLTATNTVTGESFDGTTEAFNAILAQTPNAFDIGEAIGVVVLDGVSGEPVETSPPFGIPGYDNLSIVYNEIGDVEAVVYKAGDTTVSTLNMTYTEGLLTGVVAVNA